MRRVFSFCVATGLMIGGLYLLVMHVLYSDVIRGLNLLVCGTLIGAQSNDHHEVVAALPPWWSLVHPREVSRRDRPFARGRSACIRAERRQCGVTVSGQSDLPVLIHRVQKYPRHGAATLQQLSDKMKITPACLSIATMYLAKGLAPAIMLVTGIKPASEFLDDLPN